MIISEFFAGGMMIAFSLAGFTYLFTDNMIFARGVGFFVIGITLLCILIGILIELYPKKKPVGVKNGNKI